MSVNPRVPAEPSGAGRLAVGSCIFYFPPYGVTCTVANAEFDYGGSVTEQGVSLKNAINNCTTAEVKIWEGLILETKLPALVVIAFLLGLVPMWLIHRAAKWRMARRISALETSVRAATPAVTPTTPLPEAKAASVDDDTTLHTPTPPPTMPPPIP